MVQTKRDSLDEGPSTQTNKTEAEMYRLLGTNRPVLHSILQHHYEMKQIFTHPLVSAFHGQQGRRKLRQPIKNTGARGGAVG